MYKFESSIPPSRPVILSFNDTTPGHFYWYHPSGSSTEVARYFSQLRYRSNDAMIEVASGMSVMNAPSDTTMYVPFNPGEGFTLTQTA